MRQTDVVIQRIPKVASVAEVVATDDLIYIDNS